MYFVLIVGRPSTSHEGRPEPLKRPTNALKRLFCVDKNRQNFDFGTRDRSTALRSLFERLNKKYIFSDLRIKQKDKNQEIILSNTVFIIKILSADIVCPEFLHIT